MGGRDAALIVQDGAVHHDPARDDMPRSVGSTVLSEPDFNSDTMAQNQFLIQKHSMILTEQVLLHRDAQLLGMKAILEPSSSVP